MIVIHHIESLSGRLFEAMDKIAKVCRGQDDKKALKLPFGTRGHEGACCPLSPC